MLSASIYSIRKHFRRSIADWLDAGTGPSALVLNSIALMLAWLFLPLESPYWRHVRQNRHRLYPHVDFERPTVADIVRIAYEKLL